MKFADTLYRQIRIYPPIHLISTNRDLGLADDVTHSNLTHVCVQVFLSGWRLSQVFGLCKNVNLGLEWISYYSISLLSH